ncbi:MAG TPA: ABC transporter ATP-binding protein [Terriglobales bacterium]|nr:ABC transporter ATP-binding protein [Terriglobales bacterium]
MHSTKVPAAEPGATAKDNESVVFDRVHKVFGQSKFLFWRERDAITHALRNVCLKVKEGEVLGLLGPNGSGKSTTLKLISTMLLPDEGRVLVHGCDTRREGQTVRRKVGFALATERSFFPRLTARENLEFFAALEDIGKREASERAKSTLSRVGLSEVASKQAMKFSSGMYQRLGIARALMKAPSLLLLDEPTRSLDIAAADELWDLVKEMSSMRMTVLLATHNFEEAAAVCDRVALLHRGELLNQQQAGRLHAAHLREFYREMTSDQPREIGVPA